MLTLKGNNYTTEDKIFLSEFLAKGLRDLTTEEGCPTGNMCPVCACRNACADLFRLSRYMETLDIR